jgi:signal transduction histidine kinase
MEDRSGIALEAMSDAVHAIAGERAVEPVLQRIVAASRVLAGARYAALGIPDGQGNFAQFITAGMSEELIAAMGPLPRTHGLLGAMLDTDRPYRTEDIKQDPRFRGWWPNAHPLMASFLGVPIRSREGILGALYLTDKEDAPGFTEEDEGLIRMLAAHAAIAIENARLYERGRELSFVEERNRLARDLHDSVVQKLFGIVLAAQSAATLFDRVVREGPGSARTGAMGELDSARGQVQKLQELAQDAIQELRSLIFQLRPAAVESDGLAAALEKHVQVLGRVYRQDIDLEVRGEARLRPDIDDEVFRIAQEALHNGLKHAAAGRLGLLLEEGERQLVLTVRDDGVGFEPGATAHRSRRLGLTSMEERAAALGGTLSIDSAPGKGTTIKLEVPLGGDHQNSRPGR